MLVWYIHLFLFLFSIKKLCQFTRNKCVVCALLSSYHLEMCIVYTSYKFILWIRINLLSGCWCLKRTTKAAYLRHHERVGGDRAHREAQQELHRVEGGGQRRKYKGRLIFIVVNVHLLLIILNGFFPSIKKSLDITFLSEPYYFLIHVNIQKLCPWITGVYIVHFDYLPPPRNFLLFHFFPCTFFFSFYPQNPNLFNYSRKLQTEYKLCKQNWTPWITMKNCWISRNW